MLEQKQKKTSEIIERALAICKCPYLSWSGGKDSTLCLFFVLQSEPDIPVVLIERDMSSASPFVSSPSGYYLSGMQEHIKKIEKEWKINLIRVSRGFDIYEYFKKMGNSVYIDQAGFGEKKPKSRNFKLNIFNAITEKYQFDLAFWGVRADESRGRAWYAKHYGDLYKIKNGVYRASPLLYWKTEEVWAFYRRYKLPYPSFYDSDKCINRNNIRSGSNMPTSGIEFGSIAWLKANFPEEYNRFIKEFPGFARYS